MSSCQANRQPAPAKKRLPTGAAATAAAPDQNKRPSASIIAAAAVQLPADVPLPSSGICAMATCSTAALRNFLLSVGAGSTSSASAPASASCSPCKPATCLRAAAGRKTGNPIADPGNAASSTATAASSGSSGASADSSGSPTPELLLSDEESESKSQQPGAADDACRCRSCRSRRAAQRVSRGLDRPTLEPETEDRLTALADWLAERDPGALYSALEESGMRKAREAGARLASALKKLAPTGEYTRDCCRSMTLLMREEFDLLRRDAARQSFVAKSLDLNHLVQLGIGWMQLCEHWFQSLAYNCAELRQLQNVMMDRLKPRPEDRETPSPMKLYLELDAFMSESESRWRHVRPRLQAWRARHCAIGGSGFGGLAEELTSTLLNDELVVKQLYKLQIDQGGGDAPAQIYTCEKCNQTLCGCYMCSLSHCVTCGLDETGNGGGASSGGGGSGPGRKHRNDVSPRGCCSSGEDEAEDVSTRGHRHGKADTVGPTPSASNRPVGGGGSGGCCAFYSEAEDFINGGTGRSGTCHHQHLLLDSQYGHHHHGQQQQPHGHHQHAAQSAGSCADKACDSAASSGNGSNGKFCDCCYCEVFGHGGGQQPPVPPKFFEKREQLRLKLRRKKQQPEQQRQQASGLAADAGGVDIDALVEFIEGAKSGKAASSKNSAKKTKQKTAAASSARKAPPVEPAASSPAAPGRQRRQGGQNVGNHQAIVKSDTNSKNGNGRSKNGGGCGVADNDLHDPEEVFKPREGVEDDNELFSDAEDNDVDPVVEKFKRCHKFQLQFRDELPNAKGAAEGSPRHQQPVKVDEKMSRNWYQ